MSELWEGNVSIEDVVLTPPTDFGVGRQHLIEAADHFGRSHVQLGIVREYVDQLLATVAREDYQPFSPSTVDIDGFIAGAKASGLLTSGEAVDEAVRVVQQAGYEGMFFAIRDRVDDVMNKLAELECITRDMSDGPEGRQGYFWMVVETNQKPWRQSFCQAHTALADLTAFWATTALICTEVHLVGVDAPSLLTEVHSQA